jgi:hypothetical protein
MQISKTITVASTMMTILDSIVEIVVMMTSVDPVDDDDNEDDDNDDDVEEEEKEEEEENDDSDGQPHPMEFPSRRTKRRTETTSPLM